MRRLIAPSVLLCFCSAAADAALISGNASITGRHSGGDAVNIQLLDDTDPVQLRKIETVSGAATGTVLGIVEVNGDASGTFDLLAFGQRTSTNRAAFTFSDVFTNRGGVAQHFNMAFHIAAGLLETSIFEPADENDDRYRAGYALDIRLNRLSAFASGAALSHGGLLETSGVDFMGTLVESGDAPNRWAYSWAGFDGNLDLGLLAPGESVAIDYNASVFALFNGLDCDRNCGAVAANFGDPFSVDGQSVIGNRSDITASVNPVPTAPMAPALFAALLLLVKTRRFSAATRSESVLRLRADRRRPT